MTYAFRPPSKLTRHNKIEEAIRGKEPEHRRLMRQDMSRPLVDEFFAWLAAQAKRISRKSDRMRRLCPIDFGHFG